MNEQGIYVPFIVDVEGGMADVADRTERELKRLMDKMSQHALNLKFDIQIDPDGEKKMKSVKSILTDTTLTSEHLGKVIKEILARINDLSNKGGFDLTKGLTESEKDILQAFSVISQKYEGTGLLVKNIISDTQKWADENARSAQEVIEYWSKIDNIINTTGTSLKETTIRMQAAMKKLQVTPAKLDNGEENAEFTRLVGIIKDAQKALFEYQTMLSDVTNTSKENLEVLQEQEQTMSVLNMQMAEWRKILQNSPVGGEEFAEAAREMGILADAAANANYQFKIMSTNTDSVKQISARMSELSRVWSEAGASAKFNSDGSLTDWGEDMVRDMEALADLSEKYGKSLEQIVAKRAELKAHQEALFGIHTTMDALNKSLSAWTSELNMAEIDSAQWHNAAQHVQELRDKIQETSDKLSEMGFKTGSIDQLNARLQKLTNQWNSLGNRFDSSGKMTAEAKNIYDEYVKVTKQLQKEGKSMSEILSKQEAITQKLQEQDRIRKRNQLILSSEANTIDRIRQKIQLLTEQLGKTKIGSARFRQISDEIEELNGKLLKAQGRTDGLNRSLRKSNSLLENLMRKTLYLFSLHTIVNFAKNVRAVTAEFELQRVALGGIIQDTTRANQLFSQIKAAAVKSPFEIKDLVSYTKQLSAYRIETDKLFDVTMRLADVSAGLGVDMSRLILAYGQVRAASVLRGQELRQFTEAGIPLVELLADKFSQLRGEIVSTGEVFELISERAVPFAMIEEIFNDMTNAGGIFYRMQEKQAETLAGQWANLKDAASIMYDEIGNVAAVNESMKSLIAMFRAMAKNWRTVADVVSTATIAFLQYKAAAAGLIPFFNLQRTATRRQMILEKQRRADILNLVSSIRKLTVAEQEELAAKKKLSAAEVASLYNLKKMNAAQLILFYRRNMNNKEIVNAITKLKLLSAAEMAQIRNLSKFQLTLKVWGLSIKNFFRTIGTAIASFWPIALLTTVWNLITNYITASREQVKAIQEVERAYHEQEQALLSIENSYKRLKNSIADVTDEEKRATKEAAAFGEKLSHAQKIVEMLKKYGLGGDFDLSLLNTDNIDSFVEAWLAQLTEANELTLDWGRNVAQVANAWEASILGIHFAGDNLTTDIKQLTTAFVKMTSDKKYREDVNSMRNYLEQLELQYKTQYDLLTKAIGEDAKLAVAQKRRNESEYQYQKRLIKNYEIIRQFAQSDQFMLTGAMKAFKPMTDYLINFETKLDEVEREFDKTWGSFEGKDEVTIKMAIDKHFAENEWEDWLKEAWIERVNNKYNMNIQVTPTIAQVDVPKGMKGILATEFDGLFTTQELENMNSVSEIGKAIEEKMKKAAEAIADADKLANNLAESDVWANETKEKIKNAQITINEELAKEEKDRNQDAIKEAFALIDALTKQNDVYDEQIQKKKESAQAEYELAKAAKERLLSEGLSDLGKDIKHAFPDLMKDAYRDMTDENYISSFLLSDEDLVKIQDASAAYDVFAKNMKAIADEREKLAGAGVTDATVAEEQARLDAERLSIEQQLVELDEQIAAWSYEDEKARYDSLRLAVQQATTAEERAVAEKELNDFVSKTNIEERAALAIERERLATQLGIANTAIGAQKALADYLKMLDEREERWIGFGKRYNFTLRDKNKGGAGQDPWIMLFKNRMSFMQDFQKGVEDMDKFLAHSASLGREQEIMKGRGLSLGIKTEDLLGTPQELREWYSDAIDAVTKKIRSMGGKEFAGLGVTEILAKDLTGRKIQKYQELLQELWKGFTDFDTAQLKKDLEDQLKKVTDEVKRSETARNFFSNILDLSGDEQLAATMTANIYGGVGEEFKERMQKQLDAAFQNLDWTELPENIWGQLAVAVSNQDFSAIMDNLDWFPEEWQKVLKQMASDNEKYNADWAKDILETYKKTKTYEERISEIHKIEAQRRKEISESEILTPEEKEKLTAASIEKENRDVTTVQVEALKNTYEWGKAFEDLDRVGNVTLNNLRTNLENLIEAQKEFLSPEQLKALTEALEKVRGMQAKRDPLDAITYGGRRALLIAPALKSRKNFDAHNEAIDKIKEYNAQAKEADKIDLDHLEDEFRDANKTMEDGINGLEEYVNAWKSVVDAVSDAFNLDEIPVLGETLQGVSDALNFVATILPVIITLNGILNATLMANPFIAAAAAIIATIGAIVGLIKGLVNAKIEKLNKKIDEQSELLDELEYQYGRIDAAMEKAFGSDYILNYNKQLEILLAKQEAYLEQARLEREKGKKKDEEKIKEYENDARDVADQIEDMQTQLSEFFSGTDLASAAEDFASAWIEAYKEFGSTTDAMSEKFNEMIESMINRSLAAKIMQEMLQPIFDQIDALSKDGILASDEIASIAALAQERIPMINQAMTNLMTSLASAGLDVRTSTAGFKGISRNIANASEESILGLAAAVNTQNFYMSYMPTINENVSAILATLTGEGGPRRAPANMGEEDVMPSVQQMVYDHLPNVDANISEILRLFRSVITPKNATTNTNYVAIK